ncbi:DUF805 domain-containing protein [Hymenobacter terrestris]|uniref:DUF805 domain-containing protein n=1 Tax=Hymenobacter terrestris TaxID=2748310 RepID=A0ABX2Q785_9BACT|nr:DUF805 domain-containing protein [Hymenobacter terrestris]NVO86130.1 DUF805 domain-containing protein [Hymenobacter terrestris]
MEYFLHGIRNYAVFSGRARRKEYWMFALFQALIGIVILLADSLLGISFGENYDFGILHSLYSLALFIPGLAVSVRRLHDVGKSGWFMFIILIPLVGVIWLLVLDCTEGTRGDNQYGPDPKAVPEFAY